MKPEAFNGHNVVLGADQPEYQPLPGYLAPDGQVATCWVLTEEELAQVIRTGRIWFCQHTFNNPLQPQLPSVERPDWIPEEPS